MTFSDRLLHALPWFVATLLVAGIVHIVSVLLMPAVAPNDAFTRLSVATRHAQTTDGGVALLAPQEPGAEVVPFEDPSLAEGVCIFDLSKGPLRVRASVDGEDFLAVSFHARTGRVFHAMTDRSAIKGKIDIVVGDAQQIDALESEETDDAPTQEIRVASPSKDGFILIRSLAKRPSDRERAEQRVRAVACEPFSAPEG